MTSPASTYSSRCAQTARALWVMLTMVGLMATACGRAPATAPPAAPNATASAPAAGVTREVTDMAGRKVTLPTSIDKIYTTSPVAQQLLYSFDPDRLLGWNYKLVEREKKYIDPKYHGLPVLGGAFGKSGAVNYEELIKRRPSFILDGGDLDDSKKHSADELQQKTGIPVFMVAADFSTMSTTFEVLGDLLGNPSRGKELSASTRRLIDKVELERKKVPATKVRVYYAENANGLTTDPKGSTHSRIIEAVGAENVADLPAKPGYGRVEVDAERLLKWNPDVIIVCPETGATKGDNSVWDNPANNPAFAVLPAVKAGKVLRAPYGPFNWFDRPPSINQVLGMVWAAEGLYPDVYTFNLVEETRSFYKTFYHYDLSVAEATQILGESGVKAG